MLYEEESKHIFDIKKRVYYRLVADDKSPKNYIKFQDINEIRFIKHRCCNPNKNQNVIKMQGKLIAEYIKKPFNY